MKRLIRLLLVLGAVSGGPPAIADNGIELIPVPEPGTTRNGSVPANLAGSQFGASSTGGGTTDAPSGTGTPGMDPSSLLQIPAGLSSLSLSLADLYDVNRVTFRSYSAIGTVRVLGSDRPLEAGSPEWQELVPPVEFGSREFVDEDFANRTLQYITFEFNLTSPGTLSPPGVMGEEFINQSSPQPPTAAELDAMHESEKSTLIPYNFASLANGSAITMVSSGPVATAHSMIDDDVTTFYEFDPDDPSATLLLDLRGNYRLNQFGLSFAAPPGQLDIYAFNVLPEPLQRTGADGEAPYVVLPNTYFESAFPVASRTFGQPVESVDLKFDEVDAQFALIRWTPAPGAEAGSPLRIHEINLTGLVPEGHASFRLIPLAHFAPSAPGFPDGLPGPGLDPGPVDIPDPVSPW